ncbi:MAG: TonB-dependent receptor plug domain-containing protein [Burkholderiaceae bacterium]
MAETAVRLTRTLKTSTLLASLLCVGTLQAAQASSEVEIVGERGRGLARVTDLLAPITGNDWLSQPSSLSVVSVSEGRALGAQRMVDLMQRDPSVELNYAPLGYYENLQVRGFAVDPILGYRINGLPVVGEVPFWMRPYEALEFVRGPVGAWLGSGAGGGLINLVTLRPGDLRMAEVQAQSHGGALLALDGSWQVGHRSALRLVAEGEHLRPPAKAARGQARGVAIMLDTAIAAWALEADLQHRIQSQITQPGSQLLGGMGMPPLNPDLVLGHSDWSQPTRFQASLLQLRLSRPLNGIAQGWHAQMGLSSHQVQTDDRSSFPWGCSNGTDPYYLFCSNGDFTLWDYASTKELRAMHALQGMAYGPFSIFSWQGQASVGLSASRRTTHMPEYSWQPTEAGYVDTGNVFEAQWSGNPGPVLPFDAFRSELEQRAIWVSWAGRTSDDWVPVPSFTLRSVHLNQGFESAFWTPRPWSEVTTSRLLGALGLSVSTAANQRWSLGWREDIEAGQRVPVTAANDGAVLPSRVMNAIELGYKWSGMRADRIALTLFHSERPYDLRLDESPLAAWPGPYVRQGREERSGLEWVIQQTLTKGWALEWTGSWLRSQVRGTGLLWLDGSEVANLPRLRSRVQVSLPPTSHNPGLTAAVTAVSGRWANRGEGVRLGGYRRFDAGLTLPPAWTGHRMQVQVAIQNLLNKRYWADASEFLGDAYLTPGQSRTVTLNLSIPF